MYKPQKIERAIKTLEQQLQEASLSYTSGKIAEAIDSYSRIIDQNPDCVQAYLERGMLLQKTAQNQAALSDFECVIKASPSAEAYFQAALCLKQGAQLEQSITYIDRALSFSPESTQMWLEKANISDDLGRYPQAIESCQKAIKYEPRNAEAHYLLGIVWCRLNHHQLALQQYNIALELGCNNREIYMNRGILQAESEHYEAAIVDFQKALRFSLDSEALYSLGMCYLKTQKLTLAIESLEDARRLNPNNPEILYYLAIAYMEGFDSFKALECLEEALKLRPDYIDALELKVQALNSRGLEYAKSENHQKAYDDFLEAIRIIPQQPQASFNLACLRLKIAKTVSEQYFALDQMRDALNADKSLINILTRSDLGVISDRWPVFYSSTIQPLLASRHRTGLFGSSLARQQEPKIAGIHGSFKLFQPIKASLSDVSTPNPKSSPN